VDVVPGVLTNRYGKLVVNKDPGHPSGYSVTIELFEEMPIEMSHVMAQVYQDRISSTKAFASSNTSNRVHIIKPIKS
jgi:hypothetical protein